jgi:hypothetical protein
MAYPSRPRDTPTVACGASRNRANPTDVNINVPGMPWDDSWDEYLNR